MRGMTLDQPSCNSHHTHTHTHTHTPYTHTSHTTHVHTHTSHTHNAHTRTAPHDAPTYFSGLMLNSTAVFLNWSSPTLPYGIIISYTITYSASSNDTQDIRLAGNETTNYTVQGLNEDTIYRFAVYASTRIGAGPSDEVTARTDEYCKLQYSNVLGYQVCYIATTFCRVCCI